MLFVAVLFFACHYYVYTSPFQQYLQIRLIVSSMVLVLCVFGAIYLLADPRKVRSRRVFAWQMLLSTFAPMFIITLILMDSGLMHKVSRPTSPLVLIYGNVFAFIMLLYPLELLNPGRMSVWRYCKYILAALLPGVFFFGYIHLTGTPMTTVGNWQDLVANLHKFDVWFRFTILVYPVCMFILIIYQKKRYISWCRTNYSNEGYINLEWINYYLSGYFLILISYLFVVVIRHYQSMLVHSAAFLVLFSFTLYHILRQEVPHLSGVADDDDLEKTPTPHATECSAGQESAAEDDLSDDRHRFVDKIPQYKSELERWMVEQKPYRDKDFKLLDVMQTLPLNRSYISRLFNEGYEETFFNFVMRYRIDESVRLLETNPDMPIRRISEMCGFSSPSVFGRAFLKNKGVTPKQYRKELEAAAV